MIEKETGRKHERNDNSAPKLHSTRAKIKMENEEKMQQYRLNIRI